MSTVLDREMLTMRKDTALDVLSKEDPQFFEAFVRILVDYVRLTSPSKNVVSYLPNALKHATPGELRNVMGWVFEQMVQEIVAASLTEEIKHYSTGELAEMFGVSITTINNWINRGKIRYHREGRGRHASVPETAIWIANDGTQVRIADIAVEYQSRMEQYKENQEYDHHVIQSELRRLEAKYKGPYESTLMLITDKTVVQERDSELWQYYLSIMGMED